MAYADFLSKNINTVADALYNLIGTIDWLYQDLGVGLTIADIFYPTLSRDCQ